MFFRFEPRPTVIVNASAQESTIEERSLERPSTCAEIFFLNEYPDVLSDSVRKEQPFRILPLLKDVHTFTQRLDFDLVDRSQEIVIGRTDGEQELRKTVEKESLEPVLFTGPNQIGEIDVSRQIAKPGVRKQVAGDPLLVVRRGRAESPEP